MTKLTKQECDQIVRLYHDGWGCISIAHITGRGKNTVKKVLKGQHPNQTVRVMNGKRPSSEWRFHKPGGKPWK